MSRNDQNAGPAVIRGDGGGVLTGSLDRSTCDSFPEADVSFGQRHSESVGRDAWVVGFIAGDCNRQQFRLDQLRMVLIHSREGDKLPWRLVQVRHLLLQLSLHVLRL